MNFYIPANKQLENWIIQVSTVKNLRDSLNKCGKYMYPEIYENCWFNVEDLNKWRALNKCSWIRILNIINMVLLPQTDP